MLILILLQDEILAKMTVRYSNAELWRYFKDEVVPEKAETQRVISVLNPDLDKLFWYIERYDARLCKRVLNVGSYYQGLKVRRSDEFDYTLCIDISTQWVVNHGHGGPHYGFKGYDTYKERLAHTIPQV